MRFYPRDGTLHIIAQSRFEEVHLREQALITDRAVRQNGNGVELTFHIPTEGLLIKGVLTRLIGEANARQMMSTFRYPPLLPLN